MNDDEPIPSEHDWDQLYENLKGLGNQQEIDEFLSDFADLSPERAKWFMKMVRLTAEEDRRKREEKGE